MQSNNSLQKSWFPEIQLIITITVTASEIMHSMASLQQKPNDQLA